MTRIRVSINGRLRHFLRIFNNFTERTGGRIEASLGVQAHHARFASSHFMLRHHIDATRRIRGTVKATLCQRVRRTRRLEHITMRFSSVINRFSQVTNNGTGAVSPISHDGRARRVNGQSNNTIMIFAAPNIRILARRISFARTLDDGLNGLGRGVIEQATCLFAANMERRTMNTVFVTTFRSKSGHNQPFNTQFQ